MCFSNINSFNSQNNFEEKKTTLVYLIIGPISSTLPVSTALSWPNPGKGVFSAPDSGLGHKICIGQWHMRR